MKPFKLKVTQLTDEVFARELGELEQRYGMSSEEFLLRFNKGELGDDLDFIDWAGLLWLKGVADARARARA